MDTDMDTDNSKTTRILHHSFTPKSFVILGVSSVASYALYKINFDLPGEATTISKFLFALRWQMPSFAFLLYSVSSTATYRWLLKALDPLDPVAERKIAAYRGCLQNTLEQLVLNVGGQLILSTYLEAHNMWVIPQMSLLFITGRIIYFEGYPTHRDIGFNLNWWPTLIAHSLSLYYMFTSGTMFRL